MTPYARAQTAAEPAPGSTLHLKTTPQLQGQLQGSDTGQQPLFLRGDAIKGRPSLETEVQGNAELRKHSLIIKADRLEHNQADDTVKAKGQVRIIHEGDVFTGTELQLKVDAFQGHFLQPGYEFLRNSGHGQASRIDFLDDKHSIAHDATFSTCKAPPGLPGWMPDWLLKASRIEFDFEDESGLARDVQLRFKDVPILGLPVMAFPLTDKRKSGVLPPSFNIDSVSGFETSLPYYWNIAPNRDMTLYPTLKTKRGVELGTEFRYLERAHSGELKLDVLPNDRLRHDDRWAYATQQRGRFDLTRAYNPVGWQVNLNRVSDDNYWKDSPRGTTSLTQRLLANDIDAHWEQGPFKARLRTLKWQTLQDATNPITAPYDKLPNLNMRWQQRWSGLDLGIETDYAKFVGDKLLTGQPDADRLHLNGQLSLPYRVPGGHFVPKVQWHSTRYSFDMPSLLGGTLAGQSNHTRTLPTYSLDAGLTFERPADWLNRDLLQTLEPRLMWTRTPYRDQQSLPVYDTAAKDFNLANIWTENEYIGNDRISATHTLTVGATSRFLAAQSGEELLRLSMAQRLRFADQNVILPGETPATASWSDLLMGVGINWSRKWQFDSTLQYSPETNRSVRTTLVARYQPSNYRVVHAAYRLKQGSSEQVDVGWQWPLDDLWRNAADSQSVAGVGLGPGRLYTVGRVNYSMQDRKVVDTIMGLEYDSGCWLTRVVLERIKNSNNTATNRIMVQLELTGFSRLGSNPTGTLKSHIPGYQFLREKTLDSPNRFTTYE